MLLSALLDAGASEQRLHRVIEALRLEGCSAHVDSVMSGPLSAKQLTIITPREETERHASELLSIVEQADLPAQVKKQAGAILLRLAQVEASIHNASIETIHLHEIGGDDTLIDIVGVLSALDELKIDRVHVSPLPLARGMIQTMHGWIPLPAPATLALLNDAPLRYVPEVEAELVTPTGAAILTSIADEFGGFPPMRLKVTGIGAGRRQLPFPNVIRVWIGEAPSAAGDLIYETLALLETNIDDLNPQVYEHVMHLLFAAGALDVTLTPIHMKKNRPGEMLSVLCQQQDADRLQSILFSESITLGVRRAACERICLPRTIVSVDTPYGSIPVKVAHWGGQTRVVPEYEDCRAAAEAHAVPLLHVMAAAQEAYRATQA